MKWAGILWREVARKTGAAMWLVHHTKKYAGSMAGDQDASRGGGALIGTARIMSTLFDMTEDEARYSTCRWTIAAIMSGSMTRRATTRPRAW